MMHRFRFHHFLVVSALAVAVTALAASQAANAQSIDLAGQWRFQLDPKDLGETQEWFNADLPDTITLPGTTDLANKGYRLNEQTMTYPVAIRQSEFPSRKTVQRWDQAGHLVREWAYVGKVWYQRTINIPPEWANKHVQLLLERVLWQTNVWLNDRRIGSYDSLAAEHRYDLGVLKPGKHRLTVSVDNGMVHNIGLISHSYGPETQSRWNGMVGDLQLIATDPVFIRRLDVYPAPDRRSVHVSATVVYCFSKKVAFPTARKSRLHLSFFETGDLARRTVDKDTQAIF